MLRFILSRLLALIPTLIGVSLLTFALTRLIPGDPVEVMLGERALDAAAHQAALVQPGLDQPLYVQFGQYLSNLLSLDLGQSLRSNMPVWDEFLARFPATLELTIAAMLWASLLGIVAGVVAALKKGSLFDQALMTLALTGYSMPIFWWALLLVMVFSVQLGIMPVAGNIHLFFDVEPVTGFMLIDSLLSDEKGAFLDALKHLVLPAIVLGTIPLAVIARMMRASLLEVLNAEYLLNARARGLAPWRVIWVHALRNALLPVITVMGLQMGSLLGGAVLTETIFSWPGIGKWLIESISARDYSVVQGAVLLIALLVMMVNLLVDIVSAWLNPRLRAQHA